MRKQKSKPKLITNRRARHDYALGNSLIVGMELTGKETKALRLGQGNLQGAYVNVKDNQLWLVNALINGQGNLQMEETEQTRTRRLLAKRHEIDKLIADKQQGNTIVPLEILTNGRYIKLRVAAARGKKKYDKRATLKQRDDLRRTQAELKNR